MRVRRDPSIANYIKLAHARIIGTIKMGGNYISTFSAFCLTQGRQTAHPDGKIVKIE